MSILNVKNVSHSFNGKYVIKNINFSVDEGQIIAIIGPSGVGKTTLFNILAGLLTPTKGEVFFKNENITGRTAKLSYMLQKDLLLDFYTIYDNIALPLVIKGVSKNEIQKKINENIEKFGLTDLVDKYPKQLSGGQRQKASLLRTYMYADKVVLLDEPFSSLDYITKNLMYDWFLNLKKELGLTYLLITHDIDEAIKLADTIYLLIGNPGKFLKKINILKNKLNTEDIKKEIFEAIIAN